MRVLCMTAISLLPTIRAQRRQGSVGGPSRAAWGRLIWASNNHL
jgi:hypothetical protein